MNVFIEMSKRFAAAQNDEHFFCCVFIFQLPGKRLR